MHARWIRPDSTGAGRARLHVFRNTRKVMKYRERRAKLLMRRGPVQLALASPLYRIYTCLYARTRRYTERRGAGGGGARACNFFIKKVFRNKNQTLRRAERYGCIHTYVHTYKSSPRARKCLRGVVLVRSYRRITLRGMYSEARYCNRICLSGISLKI